MNEVVEKLTYEYELFYLECMCQSRAGIFARSSEIELKKQIMQYLKGEDWGQEKFEEELLVTDNILEDAYRYVEDHRCAEESLGRVMGRWLGAVKKRGGIKISGNWQEAMDGRNHLDERQGPIQAAHADCRAV